MADQRRYWVVVEAPCLRERDQVYASLMDALPPSEMVPNGIWHLSPGHAAGRSYSVVTLVIDAPDVAAASVKLNQFIIAAMGEAGFDIATGIIRIAPYESWERAYESERNEGPINGPGDYTFNAADWVG